LDFGYGELARRCGTRRLSFDEAGDFGAERKSEVAGAGAFTGRCRKLLPAGADADDPGRADLRIRSEFVRAGAWACRTWGLVISLAVIGELFRVKVRTVG